MLALPQDPLRLQMQLVAMPELLLQPLRPQLQLLTMPLARQLILVVATLDQLA